MGQWVQLALLYWSQDDKPLMAGTHWDFLDAPQSAKIADRLEQSNEASVLVIYNAAPSSLDKDKRRNAFPPQPLSSFHSISSQGHS